MNIPDLVDICNNRIIGIFKTETDYIIISHKSADNWNLKFQKISQIPTKFEKYLFSIPSYLVRDIHVIISTRSGTCLAPLFFEQVIEPLLKVIGAEYKSLHTTTHNSIKEFGAKITGELSLRRIIDKAHSHSHLTVVLFPMGTGNAIFNSHIKNGLETFLHGHPKPLPNFRATFNRASLNGEPIDSMLGAVVASYGFHATLVDESEKYRELGDERFKMVAVKLLENPRKYIGSVNGEVMKGYAVATMVKKVDKDFTISPKNELRLIHTDLSCLKKGYSEGLGAWNVDKVEFHAEGKMCIDGLIVDVHGQAMIEEVESRLDLVT